MNQEKRQQPRKFLQTIVEIRALGENVVGAISADVSMGGMSLFINDQYLQSGQICGLRFDLMVRGKVLGINTLGQVAYNGPYGGDAYKVGLKFVSLDTLSLWTVEAFLREPAKELSSAVLTMPQV